MIVARLPVHGEAAGQLLELDLLGRHSRETTTRCQHHDRVSGLLLAVIGIAQAQRGLQRVRRLEIGFAKQRRRLQVIGAAAVVIVVAGAIRFSQRIDIDACIAAAHCHREVLDDGKLGHVVAEEENLVRGLVVQIDAAEVEIELAIETRLNAKLFAILLGGSPGQHAVVEAVRPAQLRDPRRSRPALSAY